MDATQTESAGFIHPCLTCGACCAQFRVSMHWSETTAAAGGRVPEALTEAFGPHQRVMRGTWEAAPRCVALDAEIGLRSRCSIHADRPQACRDLAASYEFGESSDQCDRARAAHGLRGLRPDDWPGVDSVV